MGTQKAASPFSKGKANKQSVPFAEGKQRRGLAFLTSHSAVKSEKAGGTPRQRVTGDLRAGVGKATATACFLLLDSRSVSREGVQRRLPVTPTGQGQETDTIDTAIGEASSGVGSAEQAPLYLNL